jgi:hypothetical protein
MIERDGSDLEKMFDRSRSENASISFRFNEDRMTGMEVAFILLFSPHTVF